MKILIIGAAGNVGRLLIGQALAAGHEVTAFVRNAAVFQPPDEKVRVIQGDVLVPETLGEAMKGQEVVLGGISAKPGKTTVYSHGASNLIAAMEQHGVRRLIWITSAAVDEEDLAHLGFIYGRIIEPLFLKDIYEDMRLSEKTLSQSQTEWVIIRPTALTDDPYTGAYRIGTWHVPHKGKEIGRAEVADFMLKQLTETNYLRKAAVLAY
ncbi:MAG TPA: SDR family oxidoreductase [Ktedonosporobacter sp.]|nr:SDR family oxidoreductase [Ktedonosporobacter sp.]